MKRLALLVGLALAATCCAARPEQIQVRLVVSEPTEGVVEQDKPGLFAPRFVQCHDCTRVALSWPDGEVERFRVEREPRLTLAPADIDKVLLAETRSPIDPAVQSWMALAVPTDKARTRMAPIVEAFPFDSVLVSIGGEALDVHSIATWSRGIRLGVFQDRGKLEAFAEQLSVEYAWVEFDEEQFNRSREEVTELLRGVMD